MTDKIPTKALIVVADGGKAILFRNTGTGGTVTLHEERRLTPDTVVAQGPSGSRPAEQTVRQTQEATFVNTVAHILHAMHGQNEFTALVIVAPPKTLGELRSALHHSLEATIVHSLPKDLTNQTTAEIQKALAH